MKTVHGLIRVVLLAGTVAAGTAFVFCPSDTVVPSLTLVYPRENDTIPKGMIRIVAVAWDNTKIDRVEVRGNEALLGQCTAGLADTYTYSWDATNAPNLSTETLKVVAYDPSGNHDEKSVHIVLKGGGPTYHSGQINDSQTWLAIASPHIIQGQLEIGGGPGATVTIEPGSRVLFEPGAGIVCGDIGAGAIVAQGTPAQPIVFTAQSATPAAGDWKSISFAQSTLNTTAFDCCSLEYGGVTGAGMVSLEYAKVTFTHCIIANSAGYGVKCGNTAGFAQFDSNEITGCAGHPIRIGPDFVRTLGSRNTFTGNAQNSIEVDGGTVATTATWPPTDAAYYVNASTAIGGPDNPVLTIGTGSTLEFAAGAELAVGQGDPGGLTADGVVFTSAQTTPAPGDWQGISFYDNSLDDGCHLTHCRIEYAGGRDTAASALTNVLIESSLPEIRGDSIGYSPEYGIFLTGTAYPPAETLMATNTFYGVLVPVGP